MNASKENAKESLKFLESLEDQKTIPELEKIAETKSRFAFVRDFIESAQRKLPSEATYTKDKKRKK